ncbi:hypothetical protein LCL98_10575 [Rossellomorea aquimaris]|nr:hypothetical protein [Rossellomorea aquimaris]
MWKSLSKTDAKKEFNSWSEENSPSFNCAGEQLKLREKLLEIDKKVVEYISREEKGTNKKDYLYDLRFGIELYELFRLDYDFRERQASSDEIWIYVSMRVIPDVVFKRWGLSESRFYKQSRRIWLKTIWWYIHLSWCGDREVTYNTLKGFTTDEIVQLVERSGPSGYRIDLTREIMNQFSKLDQSKIHRNLFRRIMKLNTARIKMVEPSLTNGGTKKFVEELIGYFEDFGNRNNGKNNSKYTQIS